MFSTPEGLVSSALRPTRDSRIRLISKCPSARHNPPNQQRLPLPPSPPSQHASETHHQPQHQQLQIPTPSADLSAAPPSRHHLPKPPTTGIRIAAKPPGHEAVLGSPPPRLTPYSHLIPPCKHCLAPLRANRNWERVNTRRLVSRNGGADCVYRRSGAGGDGRVPRERLRRRRRRVLAGRRRWDRGMKRWGC